MSSLAGKPIGHIGYGLMGFTWRPTQVERPQAFAAMKAALDSGANFWNGGEFYGPTESNSLHLLNAYFTKYPEDADKVVISIKGGGLPGNPHPDGSAKNLRRSVDECLRVLDGKKHLDIFECARVDPNVPIESVMRVLKEYVDAGKMSGIGLSEVSANSIRRAAKIVKIASVEVEFSMFATEILDNDVAKVCAELSIPIVAYSPLGRGILTGQIKSVDDLPEGDLRRRMPRYQPGNFESNIEAVKAIEDIAKAKGVTPGQIAIAWTMTCSGRPGCPAIIPIPGATTQSRVLENCKHVSLTTQEIASLDDFVNKVEVKGGRYPEAAAKLSFGDSKEE